MQYDVIDFIYMESLKDISLTDRLINYFDTHEHLAKPGYVAVNGKPGVDTDTKDSMDICIEPCDTPQPGLEVFEEYVNELSQIARNYYSVFPMANNYAAWKITSSYNLQKYKPGGGFKTWHTERCAGDGMIGSRHLVWMTYLNDVTDGGETDFYHQRIKVQPKKGLTLIWPVDWTHTHRGIPSPTQEKYVITGWFNFFDRDA
jgi:hypothetical protein